MASTEESPAQQAARLRRERREAKIKASGAARLDKITSLSGRTPAAVREDTLPSVSRLTPTPEPQPQPLRQSPSPLPPSPDVVDQTPESIQAQEAYIRALLRSQQPLDEASPQEEDPASKLLSSLLGAVPTATGSSDTPGPPIQPSPQELLSNLGLPSLLTRTLFGGQSKPLTPADQWKDRVWKALHLFFAAFVGIYLLVLFRSSTTTYGTSPPPPSTAQNPFVVFLTGEAVLNGTRVLSRARAGQLSGVMPWVRLLNDILRDGRIVIFVLGIGLWWTGAG
ncbi:hypothetical protein AJ80_09322 [Polytolypa hystricis UAMH7299]|uniref:GET complex, subunit GET2 n=1 Tax=Polytolypa hystricis (strain UAMH7299) TaxID=1447883 RepID=A0A2B7WT30_POLH7|nr:hypothetical protein AJ80_09322 [Polytolypa hystricis UAMH7299]